MVREGGLGGGLAKASVRSRPSQDGRIKQVAIAVSMLKKLYCGPSLVRALRQSASLMSQMVCMANARRVQAHQDGREVLPAVSEAVLKVVALVLQNVERSVLDFPLAPAHRRQAQLQCRGRSADRLRSCYGMSFHYAH